MLITSSFFPPFSARNKQITSYYIVSDYSHRFHDCCPKIDNKAVFLTVYFDNLDIKTENRITTLKAIPPEILKFRYLAMSAT
jgi:hypothetical protein